MHVIAWLLTQRAVDAGEMEARDALDPSRRLGPGPVSEEAAVRAMPLHAQSLIEMSTELYRRVARLDQAQSAN
jgi:regulator of CtrA degradation